MKIRVAVITASTTGYAGKREDISGAKICEIVEEAGMEVTFKKILPDDRETLAKVMAVIADSQMADLILTTGGTGFSKQTVHQRRQLIFVNGLSRGFRKQCVRQV